MKNHRFLSENLLFSSSTIANRSDEKSLSDFYKKSYRLFVNNKLNYV